MEEKVSLADFMRRKLEGEPQVEVVVSNEKPAEEEGDDEEEKEADNDGERAAGQASRLLGLLRGMCFLGCKREKGRGRGEGGGGSRCRKRREGRGGGKGWKVCPFVACILCSLGGSPSPAVAEKRCSCNSSHPPTHVALTPQHTLLSCPNTRCSHAPAHVALMPQHTFLSCPNTRCSHPLTHAALIP